MRLASFRDLALPLLLVVGCGDSSTAPNGGGGSGTGATSGDGGSKANGGAPASGGGGEGTAGAPLGGQAAGGAGPEDPWAGPLVNLKELDLGDVDNGVSKVVPIPDRTLGFTLLIQADSEVYFGIMKLRPASTLSSIIDNFAIPGTDYPVFADKRTLTAANPQSDLPDTFPVTVGDWSLRVATDTGLTTVHERLFVRRTNDGAFHGGAVDFHVYIAPGSGVGQSYVQAALEDVFASYYTPLLGLTMGSVDYGTLSSTYDLVNDSNEYRQLLASSAAASAPAVNLFVVGDFGGDLDQALGVAGGVPASPMVHGTTRSGLAYTPTGDTGYDASVLAHEIGHVAGLFHTTEFATVAFDPLGDTAECPDINSMNPQNCPDVNNVMFPIAYGGFQMTPLQARIVQSSTLYRGKLDDQSPPAPPLHPGQVQMAAAPPAPSFELPAASVGEGPLDPLSRALHAHVCGTPEADYLEALASSLPAEEAARLEAIARDPSTFDVARGRAIALLALLALDDEASARLVEIARAVLSDEASGRRARVAALVALDALDPVELSRVAETSPALADPVVLARVAALGL